MSVCPLLVIREGPIRRGIRMVSEAVTALESADRVDLRVGEREVVDVEILSHSNVVGGSRYDSASPL